jgi:hypothetical protein
LQQSTKEWEAKVGYQSTRISAGAFPTQVEAAHAYDRLLLRLKGADQGQYMNFPQDFETLWPQVEAELAAEAAEAEAGERRRGGGCEGGAGVARG